MFLLSVWSTISRKSFLLFFFQVRFFQKYLPGQCANFSGKRMTSLSGLTRCRYLITVVNYITALWTKFWKLKNNYCNQEYSWFIMTVLISHRSSYLHHGWFFLILLWLDYHLLTADTTGSPLSHAGIFVVNIICIFLVLSFTNVFYPPWKPVAK